MPKLVLRARQFALIHSAVNNEANKTEDSLKTKLALILGEEACHICLPDKFEEACKKLEKSLELLNTKIKLVGLENEEPSEKTKTTLVNMRKEASDTDAMLKEIKELYQTCNDLKYVGIILGEKSTLRDSFFELYDITEEERREFKQNEGSDNYLI